MRDDRYRLMIPNQEIRTIYVKEITSYLKERLGFDHLDEVGDAIVLGQASRLAELLWQANEALRRIEDKRYIADFLPEVKKVIGYGISFCHKRCEIVQREWQR